MRIHVLVEGKSEEILISKWGPRALPNHQVVPHAHQGKGDIPANPASKPDPRKRGLLDLLPATLRAYAKADDVAVLVLVDADKENCVDLKQRLLKLAERVHPRPSRLLFRIAVEETEAFYLGDVAGLKAAYPQADIRKAKKYRPDSVCNTAELFGEIVQDGGLNKVAWAEAMADTLTTKKQGSRSPSFRALLGAFEKLVADPDTPIPPQKPRKPKHWKSRHSSTRKRMGG
ncbi:MAG: DUF4276 family protein [Planctomycetes bacterium]|jgi:hypothetical protein|nr:DUF4276 family protein [Planctomycetota bacterium]